MLAFELLGTIFALTVCGLCLWQCQGRYRESRRNGSIPKPSSIYSHVSLGANLFPKDNTTNYKRPRSKRKTPISQALEAQPELKRRRPVTRSTTRKTTTPYQYSPLDEETREIRLLTLLPGIFSAEIHILLHVTSFTEHYTPKYEALSYAWGSTENPVAIKVGTSEKDRLAITQDLAIALQHLRLENKTRILWIDAICVDQQNLQERGHQVRRMGDIYRRAERVVVWLGPAKDQSSLALKLLRELSSKIAVNWPSLTMEATSKEPFEQHWASIGIKLPFKIHQWHAIQSLLDRSWFERLWIWQEIRLADPKSAIVMCGFDVVRWQDFRDAIFCLCYKPLTSRLFEKARQAWLLCDSTGKLSIYRLAQRTEDSKCADDRDRIYALLSICDNRHGQSNIIPDYTKSASQVYQDITLHILNESQDIDVLRSCEISRRRMDMPSWVPDWSCKSDFAPLIRQRADGSTSSHTSYLGEGVLQTTGVFSGSLAYLKSFLPQNR
jgi:hypothetical protein